MKQFNKIIIMKHCICLLLVSLFISSCSNRPGKNEGILSLNPIELKTEKINHSEIVARGAYPLVVIDSMFFLFNGDPSSGTVVLKESDASEIAQFLT